MHPCSLAPADERRHRSASLGACKPCNAAALQCSFFSDSCRRFDPTGMINLEDWSHAFRDIPESEPATQEALGRLILTPMRGMPSATEPETLSYAPEHSSSVGFVVCLFMVFCSLGGVVWSSPRALRWRGPSPPPRPARILSDMGLDPDRDESERQAVEMLFSSLRAGGGTNVDPTDGSLRVPAFEFLRVMHSQEFLRGEAGRYWVALSLREAESLRGAMHAAMDAEVGLIEGKKTAVGLRIGDLLLDAVGPSQLDGSAEAYAVPPRQQLHSAVQAMRLLDTQHAYNSFQVRLLLRMLRVDACDERKRWVNDVAACRRRPRAKIEQLRGTGLPTVLTVDK